MKKDKQQHKSISFAQAISLIIFGAWLIGRMTGVTIPFWWFIIPLVLDGLFWAVMAATDPKSIFSLWQQSMLLRREHDKKIMDIEIAEKKAHSARKFSNNFISIKELAQDVIYRDLIAGMINKSFLRAYDAMTQLNADISKVGRNGAEIFIQALIKEGAPYIKKPGIDMKYASEKALPNKAQQKKYSDAIGEEIMKIRHESVKAQAPIPEYSKLYRESFQILKKDALPGRSYENGAALLVPNHLYDLSGMEYHEARQQAYGANLLPNELIYLYRKTNQLEEAYKLYELNKNQEPIIVYTYEPFGDRILWVFQTEINGVPIRIERTIHHKGKSAMQEELKKFGYPEGDERIIWADYRDRDNFYMSGLMSGRKPAINIPTDLWSAKCNQGWHGNESNTPEEHSEDQAKTKVQGVYDFPSPKPCESIIPKNTIQQPTDPGAGGNTGQDQTDHEPPQHDSPGGIIDESSFLRGWTG